MSREVRFIVPRNCKGIAIDHQGFVGPACYQQLAEFKRIMAAMGVEFAGEDITPKAEAFAVESEVTGTSETEKAGE